MQKRNIKRAKVSKKKTFKLYRLKTGLFKWNPDYNSAVGYFEDAGNFCLIKTAKNYKSAKAWDKCIDALE